MREHQHAAERIIRDAAEMKAKGRTLPGCMSDALRLAEHYMGEPNMRHPSMCPHCGWVYENKGGLVPKHVDLQPLNFAEPPTTAVPANAIDLCPGSEQCPRNPRADRRPLWNGQPNPHIDEIASPPTVVPPPAIQANNDFPAHVRSLLVLEHGRTEDEADRLCRTFPRVMVAGITSGTSFLNVRATVAALLVAESDAYRAT